MAKLVQVRVTNVFAGHFGGDAIITGMRYVQMQSGYKTKLVRLKINAGKCSFRLPKKGEFIEAKGSWIPYKNTYQLLVESCSPIAIPRQIINDELIKSPLKLPSVLEYYFTNHPNFKGIGVGVSRLQKAITTYGSVKVFMADLANKNIAGLTDAFNGNSERAIKFTDAYHLLEAEIDTAQYLNQSGLETSDVKTVISLLGTGCKIILQKNPYCLLAFGGRLARKGWELAEHIRQDNRISLSDERRLIGAIDKIVYDRLSEGHTAISKDNAMADLSPLLNDPVLASDAIKIALKQKTLCSMGDFVQGVGPAQLEIYLERTFVALIRKGQQSLFEFEVDEAIDEYSEVFKSRYGYSLVAKQLAAIKMAFSKACAVMQGEGGTGKTTALAGIKYVGNKINRPVYFIALAGIAQRKIYQILSNEQLLNQIKVGEDEDGQARYVEEPTCFTIHSFINAIRATRIREKERPLDIKISGNPIIVMDETSMPDVGLFCRLLEELGSFEFSLFMGGDVAQLAPVGFGIVWHKLNESKYVPKIELEQVHRQSLENPLKPAASKIRNGELPLIPKFDFKLPANSQGAFIRACPNSDLIEEAFDLAKHLGMDNSQVIAPTKTWVNKTNTYFQKHDLDPLKQDERHYQQRFWAGDRVICTMNNHELGLQNGDLGTFLDVIDDEGTSYARFSFHNDTMYQLQEEDIYKCRIKLGWCITVHKTQGAEFKNTIVILPKLNVRQVHLLDFIERSLIYTALTRSKNTTVFVGCRETLEFAIKSLPRWQTLQTLFDVDKYFELDAEI